MRAPMVVYIAGGISGLPDLNRPAFRDAVIRVSAAGHRPLNPHDICAQEFGGRTDLPHEEYMRVCILNLVRYEDAIVLLPGWRRSKGARLEARVAKATGKKFIELESLPVRHSTGRELAS